MQKNVEVSSLGEKDERMGLRVEKIDIDGILISEEIRVVVI